MEGKLKNENVDIIGNENDDMVVSLKKPISFEGRDYEEINLAGLHDIKAADMVAISRRMARSGSDYVTPEMSLEYAMHMANIATGLPLEFFDQLPPYAAMAIRSRVMGFLFR